MPAEGKIGSATRQRLEEDEQREIDDTWCCGEERTKREDRAASGGNPRAGSCALAVSNLQPRRMRSSAPSRPLGQRSLASWDGHRRIGSTGEL